MPMVKRGTLFSLAAVSTVAILAAAAFAWSGLYDIGADDTHTRPVAMVLQAVRKQSINHHAAGIKVPALDDAGVVKRGAGNFEAMCSQCHTPPGEEQGELSRGLYPAPADLTRTAGNPAHQFWVIKHGIKASGMPAWGRSMDDSAIWGIVAFLQRLPGMDAAQYDALVASSGGHSHAGAHPQGAQMHSDMGAMPASGAHIHAEANGMPADAGHMHAEVHGTQAHADHAKTPPGATQPKPR